MVMDLKFQIWNLRFAERRKTRRGREAAGGQDTHQRRMAVERMERSEISDLKFEIGAPGEAQAAVLPSLP
jgi:hypothetical protein